VRQPKSRKRKRNRTFGKLAVSVVAGNTESWLREGGGLDAFVADIAKKRSRRGYQPDANVAV
jgi:hypothetical protein